MIHMLVFIVKLLKRLNMSLNVFSVILIIALCIDFLASFYYMYKHQDFYHLWEHKSISGNIRELIITR